MIFMRSRAQSNSGRPFCSVNIRWLDSVWCPRIRRGTLVSDLARWSPEAFQSHCSRVVCVGPAAGVPPTGLFGVMLPPRRPRIQFPTL